MDTHYLLEEAEDEMPSLDLDLCTKPGEDDPALRLGDDPPPVRLLALAPPDALPVTKQERIVFGDCNWQILILQGCLIEYRNDPPSLSLSYLTLLSLLLLLMDLVKMN